MKLERKELFRTLVGSHNYNLNTRESDKDYKVFVAPTFDDLYFNNQYSKSIIGVDQDLDIHDIRKVSNLWWKSNVNFIEVLFSNEITYADDISGETKKLIMELYEMKDEIAIMNLPYLFNACYGMYLTKMKQVEKGTSGTQHLVDQFGFDTKQALHSIRILDFLKRFADNNFTDFKEAIEYEDDEEFRLFLLEIKHGKYSLEEVKEFTKEIVEEIENNYKSKYYNEEPNNSTNEKLINIVKQIVKNEL